MSVIGGGTATAVRLLVEGIEADNAASLVGPVQIGALLFGWVSAGVVRVRTGRLVLAWVVLAIAGAVGVAALFLTDGPADLVVAAFSLATTGAALAGLWAFRSTDWYAWQGTRPAAHEGASIIGVDGGVTVTGARP